MKFIGMTRMMCDTNVWSVALCGDQTQQRGHPFYKVCHLPLSEQPHVRTRRSDRGPTLLYSLRTGQLTSPSAIPDVLAVFVRLIHLASAQREIIFWLFRLFDLGLLEV